MLCGGDALIVQLSADKELTHDLIKEIISKHKKFAKTYTKLQDYYKGDHAITERNTEENKPNNKLVNNYASYITDISTGYFVGKAVTYSADDKGLNESIQEVNTLNDEADENAEIAKQASINGHCFEILYMDSEANVRFKYQKPQNIVLIYDDTIERNILYGIRYFKSTSFGDDADVTNIEVYTAETIEKYRLKNDELEEVDIEEHYFGEVPIIEYVNNEELIGDFQAVLSLIDAYNLAQSDSANDFEYFTDAYLILKNYYATSEEDDSEDYKKMRQERVLFLGDEGDAKFLIKEINDTAVENYKSRIQKDIHRFSKVPNLTDEEFAGNVSGVALKYKLWGIEQITAIKERKFRKALMKRWKLIFKILSIKGQTFELKDLKMEFHRNIPQNDKELVEMLDKLQALLSKETLISLLPFIEDAKKELALKLAEDKERIKSFDTNSFSDDTEIDEGDSDEE